MVKPLRVWFSLACSVPVTFIGGAAAFIGGAVMFIGGAAMFVGRAVTFVDKGSLVGHFEGVA